MFSHRFHKPTFRWTASGGMEDLNQTYAYLLTNESILTDTRDISPDGRFIVGWGDNKAAGRYEAFLLDTQEITGIEKGGKDHSHGFYLTSELPHHAHCF